MDEEFKAELRAFMADVNRRLAELEIHAGLRDRPKVAASPPADNGYGRRSRDDMLIDRMVMAANPGKMLQQGKMVGAPSDGRAWNDGGRR